MQRTILEEKRRLLDRAIGAIANAETVVQSGQPPGAAVFRKIIEAIEMQVGTEDATEFMKNYYRGDAWVRFRERHRDWPSHQSGTICFATLHPRSRRTRRTRARRISQRVGGSCALATAVAIPRFIRVC